MPRSAPRPRRSAPRREADAVAGHRVTRGSSRHDARLAAAVQGIGQGARGDPGAGRSGLGGRALRARAPSPKARSRPPRARPNTCAARSSAAAPTTGGPVPKARPARSGPAPPARPPRSRHHVAVAPGYQSRSPALFLPACCCAPTPGMKAPDDHSRGPGRFTGGGKACRHAPSPSRQPASAAFLSAARVTGMPRRAAGVCHRL